MLEKAKAVCLSAHQGQVDKCGQPYYLHSFAVADMVEGEDAKVVAYLHDVVEDTPVTIDDLAGMGFPPRITDAVEAMTRRDDEPYFEYIKRLGGNELARTVKLADLTHNTDPARDGATQEMRERYAKAKEMLQSLN